MDKYKDKKNGSTSNRTLCISISLLLVITPPLITILKTYYYILAAIILIINLALFILSCYFNKRCIKLSSEKLCNTVKDILKNQDVQFIDQSLSSEEKEVLDYLSANLNEMNSFLAVNNNRIHTLTESLKQEQESSLRLKKELTEIKQKLTQSENRALQTEKQKSLTAIVSGFAHEINNPLTGIIGYIDIIEMRAETSDYVKNKLKDVKKQALRIKDIISELNQLDPAVEKTKLEINLINLFEKLIKIITNKSDVNNINFNLAFDSDEILVYGNHFCLWQTFESVIQNSIEALTPCNTENKCINIRIAKDNSADQAIIEVQDNGPGFKNIDKAFDPFYTTKNRTEKKGIGLAIAYNIIQEHKGKISVTNSEPGAIVSIILPLL